jgi:hypothetical protein
VSLSSVQLHHFVLSSFVVLFSGRVGSEKKSRATAIQPIDQYGTLALKSVPSRKNNKTQKVRINGTATLHYLILIVSAAFPGYQALITSGPICRSHDSVFCDQIPQIPIFIGQHSLDWFNLQIMLMLL